MELQLDCFDPFKIADSGQCFRMEANGNIVETIALGRRLAITDLGNNRFRFDCTAEEFDRIWRPYFALDTDYSALLAAAPEGDAYLARALAHTRGLRVLRQDPWETLCCFILSQRKNLKAIRTCVEKICDTYGEPMEGTARKSFPSPERLAAGDGGLCLCGLGYRAPYLLDAARQVADGRIDLSALAALPDAVLAAALQTIHGVGIKVANCVMLFAYGRLSCVPVDVWIQRVINVVYGGRSPFAEYGPYAGVYQQALFMFARDTGFEAYGPISEPSGAC